MIYIKEQGMRLKTHHFLITLLCFTIINIYTWGYFYKSHLLVEMYKDVLLNIFLSFAFSDVHW